MAGTRPELNVIAGGARTDKVALSLVHSSGRIDVPVKAILWIEAREDFSYFVKAQMRALPSPHVEVNFRFDVRARLYKLTRAIVGEPLEIFVNGESVSKAIVREPLGGRAHLRISTSDFDEARFLAARLRERCGKTGPRLVS
jgi:preprotein translocase subunit SecD